MNRKPLAEIVAAPYQHPAARSGRAVEPFFDLTIPDHAYLFGLLQTDGSLSEGQRQKGVISLELTGSDAPLLGRISEMVPWYSSVRYRTRRTNFSAEHTSACLTLCSLDARDELKALGLPVGRKSRVVRPPAGPYSRRDYMRGLIDGDGSVGITGQGLPFLAFVSDSEYLAQYVADYCEVITGAARTIKRNARDNILNLMYTKEAALTLAVHLYRPEDMALPRKAKAAEAMSNWRRPPTMRRRDWQVKRWTADEDAVLLGDGTPAEIAAELGRTIKSVSIRRWRLSRL